MFDAGALFEKVRLLTQAVPFKAYVPVSDFSPGEQALMFEARADVYDREGMPCYCVWNVHMCLRSLLAMREELECRMDVIADKESAQIENFCLEG